MAPPTIARQAVAEFSPEEIEIYPELENSPRSGPYSKSMSFSRWECLNSVLFGSRGITINHYDMMGNGIALDRRFGTMLRDAKPRLDALGRTGMRRVGELVGVDVLFFAGGFGAHAFRVRPDSLFGSVQTFDRLGADAGRAGDFHTG